MHPMLGESKNFEVFFTVLQKDCFFPHARARKVRKLRFGRPQFSVSSLLGCSGGLLGQSRQASKQASKAAAGCC